MSHKIEHQQRMSLNNRRGIARMQCIKGCSGCLEVHRRSVEDGVQRVGVTVARCTHPSGFCARVTVPRVIPGVGISVRCYDCGRAFPMVEGS